MPSKRLALICGITLADYLLWNWSVGGNHDLLALVSGLTLPFLVLASAVLLLVSLARVISGSIRRPQRPLGRRRPGAGESPEHRARLSGNAAGRLRRAGRPATGPSSPEPASGSVPSRSPSTASSARQRAA
jgi:hypothetical protein